MKCLSCGDGGWRLLVFGMIIFLTGCHSRAVNISNTWTLPQEGFSVFYRFFRDKISWFEADAVCQFHHANLVTVENGVQFDAARAFLKELDVTEFVWIGLMRPQNTDYFVWTNSKPLDSTSGYWADPFPVMESPLCAVIDPVRDFRWHALRCGGPETAAFLCEMEVPDWATECAIRAMPSLTVQYMSDSGTVELSRDCGEEGTRHMSCRGKEDRDTILNELTCVDEIDTTDNTLKGSEPGPDLSEVHQKSVELIKKITSDNREDNNIDVNLNNIESSDTKPINRVHLDDMMMGDQPVSVPEQPAKPVTMDPKPIKKPKKVDEKYYKKASKKKNVKKAEKYDEEVMMGDQPVDDHLNPAVAEEHLPHSKKSLPQDLKHKTDEATLHVSTTKEPKVASTSKAYEASTTIAPSTESPVTETRLRRETEMSTVEPREITSTASPIAPLSITTEDSQHHANSHLIKMNKKSSNPAVSPIHSSKDKMEVESSNDHFIPPMLLVRTKFTSTKSHMDNTIFEEIHTISDQENIRPESTPLDIISDHNPASTASDQQTTVHPLIPTTISALTVSQSQSTTEAPQTTVSVEIPTSTSEPITTSTSVPSTTFKFSTIETDHTSTSVHVTETTEKVIVEHSTSGPSFRQPHAPKKPKVTPATVSSTSTVSTTITTEHFDEPTTPLTINDKIVEIRIDGDTTFGTLLVSTKIPTPENDQQPMIGNTSPVPIDQQVTTETSTMVDSNNSSKDHLTTTEKQSETTVNDLENLSTTILSTVDDHQHEYSGNHSDFTNAENYKPYRPNRRRSLTKPETHTYIKKILG